MVSRYVAGAASPGGLDAEGVRDTVAAALVAGPNITITPDDAADTITIAAAGGGGTSGPVPSGGNDFTAVQNYLTALGNQANGGVWDLGGQNFIIRSALSVPPKVHLRNGKLTFDTDLGAGVTAVTLNGDNTTAPTLTNVEIFGPGSTFAVGTVATQMDGVRCCPQSTMILCKVYNFRSNVLIKDNHERFFACRFTNGYYNVYFQGGATTFGDQSFFDCDLSGARWASVAVAPTNVADTVMFSSGHTGFAPYCFYKETGTANRGFISDTQMIGLSFEQVGNAAILDDSSNPTANGSFSYSVIDSAGFTWNPTYKIAARARDYAVSVGLSEGSKVRASDWPYIAGDIAAYKFAAGPTWLDFTHEGDPPANMFATATAAFHGATIITNGYRAKVMRASGTITAGHYLERAGTVDVRSYGSSSGTGEVGVAVNGATNLGYVIVATDGEVDALCVTTGSHGVPLVPDTAQNGRLRPVTSSGNGYPGGTAGLEPSKYPIVATSAEGGGGGAAGGALMRVRLNVTQDRTYVRPGTVASLPTAAVAYRGQILVVEGGTGVADVASICLKNASNAYAWLPIT